MHIAVRQKPCMQAKWANLKKYDGARRKEI